MTTLPDLPSPAGAIAGDWSNMTGHPDAGRGVSPGRLHNVVPVRLTVAGAQYVDGRVERCVLLCVDAGGPEMFVLIVGVAG